MNLCYSGQETVLASAAKQQIVFWICSMRKDGCPTSAQMLKNKVLKVAADAGLSTQNFKASHSMRYLFMRRHKLFIRTGSQKDQTMPEDAALTKAKFTG
eukprot:jgi/Phyca11/98358/e_gw1.2.1125.1